MRVFEIPHIVGFSKFSPDDNMLSEDRHVVKNIERTQGIQISQEKRMVILLPTMGMTKLLLTTPEIKDII